jgi:hypothetical protein
MDLKRFALQGFN